MFSFLMTSQTTSIVMLVAFAFCRASLASVRGRETREREKIELEMRVGVCAFSRKSRDRGSEEGRTGEAKRSREEETGSAITDHDVSHATSKSRLSLLY